MGSITYAEFERQAASGRFELKPVMAAAGGEAFVRGEAVAMLRAFLGKSGYTVERFNDDERGGDDLVRLLRTPSLFGEKTAVLLRSVRRGNRQEAVVRFKDQLLDYFERPAKGNLLVIDGETWNGNFAVPRKVKEQFVVIECPEFKPWQTAEIHRFIEARAKTRGAALAADAVAELRDMCAGDLALVDRELEKLSLIAGGKTLSVRDVQEHLSRRADDTAFALNDAVLDSNRTRALAYAANVMRDNDPGTILQLLGLLESQLRKLGRLSALLAAGASPATALGQAGFNPRSPRAAALQRAAREMDTGKLRRFYRAMLDADVAVKSGEPDLGALLVRLIVTLTPAAGLPEPLPAAYV